MHPSVGGSLVFDKDAPTNTTGRIDGVLIQAPGSGTVLVDRRPGMLGGGANQDTISRAMIRTYDLRVMRPTCFPGSSTNTQTAALVQQSSDVCAAESDDC
jgi:hypothetical protein